MLTNSRQTLSARSKHIFKLGSDQHEIVMIAEYYSIFVFVNLFKKTENMHFGRTNAVFQATSFTVSIYKISINNVIF